MRVLLRFLLVFMACRLFAADDAGPPPPVLPQNLTLTSKAVLRKISVVRWEKDRVVIHHLGGTDPIYYKYIAEPDRTTMLALRDAQLSHPTPRAPVAVADPAAPVEGKYAGQIYVGTAVSPFKLPGVTVLILPPEAADRFKDANATVVLPQPLQQVMTDADGMFSFELAPKAEFFLVAQSYRMMAGQRVYYHWHIASSAIKDPAHIVFNAENAANESKKLQFDR